MKKNVLFSFVLMMFLAVLTTLIVTSNPMIVKADDDAYYLVDNKSSYIIENKGSEELTCNTYTKDNAGNYNQIKYGDLDYVLYDTAGDLKKSNSGYSALEMKGGEKAQVSTHVKDPFYIKVPKTCKVTKTNELLWSIYNLKKGKSIFVKNNNPASDRDFGISYYIYFRGKDKDDVTFDYRYAGSNNCSYTGQEVALKEELISAQQSIEITAEYEDVQILIPSYYYKDAVVEADHPVFRKITLPAGESIILSSHAKWFSHAYFDQKADIIDLSAYVGVGMCLNFDYEWYGSIESLGMLGFYAGYGKDINIYTPYEDDWRIYHCEKDLFEDYTLKPGQSMSLENTSDDRLLIHFLNAENKYYYTENDIKTGKIIATSDNAKTDEYGSVFKENVIDIRGGASLELKNISDSDFTVRVPNPIDDMISYTTSYNRQFSTAELAKTAKFYNMTENDEKWNSEFDFNNDKIIDIYDLSYVAGRLV